MEDSIARANAKIAISLNLVGMAGTIPAIALIAGPYHSVITSHIQLGLAIFILFWLFVIGTVISLTAFQYDSVVLGGIGIALWMFGLIQFGVILGRAVVPEWMQDWLITAPVIVIVFTINVCYRLFHKR